MLIFIRLMATVLSAPLAATMLSSVLWAWKWLVVSLISTPSVSDSHSQTLEANSGWSVHSSADSGAAQRYLTEFVFGLFKARYSALYLSGVAEELLSEPDRSGVLEVGASGLDDWHKLVRLSVEVGLEFFQSGDEFVVYRLERGDMDGGRDDGRLRTGRYSRDRWDGRECESLSYRPDSQSPC